jgi:hypothetical protein
MKKYLFTSPTFTGEVEFIFNDAGLLVSFDTKRAELSEVQQIWILKLMPRELCELQRVLGDSKTATLTEIKQEVTFEMFYARYHVTGNNDSPKNVTYQVEQDEQVGTIQGISLHHPV